LLHGDISLSGYSKIRVKIKFRSVFWLLLTQAKDAAVKKNLIAGDYNITLLPFERWAFSIQNPVKLYISITKTITKMYLDNEKRQLYRKYSYRFSKVHKISNYLATF